MTEEEEQSPTERLGEQVRHARMARGWSQGDLAETADVSRATVARIEAGQDISTSTLVKVARALDLDVVLLPPEERFTALTRASNSPG